MGAKFEFSFLVNESNYNILAQTIHALFACGATYNKEVQGKYTYWMDGPIWNYGDSRTISEENDKTYSNPTDMKEIIWVLSKHYSPNIIFGLRIKDRVVPLGVDLFEGEGSWRELGLFLDRQDAYDDYDNQSQREISEIFIKLFKSIVLETRPYYGIWATEIMGLPASPELLNVKEILGGDLTYLSSELLSRVDIHAYELKFQIVPILDVGIMLVTRKNLFGLGE